MRRVSIRAFRANLAELVGRQVVVLTRRNKAVAILEPVERVEPLRPEDRVDPVIEAYKPGVDRTLIRENLRLTPEERVRKLEALQDFAEGLRRARRAS